MALRLQYSPFSKELKISPLILIDFILNLRRQTLGLKSIAKPISLNLLKKSTSNSLTFVNRLMLLTVKFLQSQKLMLLKPLENLKRLRTSMMAMLKRSKSTKTTKKFYQQKLSRTQKLKPLKSAMINDLHYGTTDPCLSSSIENGTMILSRSKMLKRSLSKSKTTKPRTLPPR